MPEQRWIDLRSDTVTKPNARMRAAMAAADVGDDVYGEDPTVKTLERRAAEILGKEAALFVPTGTMGNTIGVKVHTHHGEEVICDARAHLMDWELSMLAWFSGCLLRTIPTTDGLPRWKQIEKTLRAKGPHNAPTTLIALENTHNMAGGTYYPIEEIDEICCNAHDRGLKVHMDGARVFNAASAMDLPVSRIVRDVDSVMFCLSKGLGGPVGSLLAGTSRTIENARLYRKRLGGGMRQAGILAAAGLIALDESPAKLKIDHANAQLLAERLARVPGIRMEAARVCTNIVIFDIADLGVTTSIFSANLKKRGILANGVDANRMRMVTHMDVSAEDCKTAGDTVAEIVAEMSQTALSV